MAKHHNQAKWESLYNSYLQHQGTMIDFCANNKINYRTFQNWCYKFKKINTMLGKMDVKGIDLNKPIKVNASKFIKCQLPQTEAIKIRLPNGIAIEFMPKNLLTIIKELAHVV